MKVGPGLAEGTILGPLVSAEQLDRVDSYVQLGKQEGAQVVTGGERGTGELALGYFYQPTVFSGVKQRMRIAREEIFGPVLSVLAYDNADEVIAYANDSEFGLAAVVWSRDIVTANKLANQVKAGTVWINGHGGIHPMVPFGGAKHSGYGLEFGVEGLKSVSVPQVING